MRKSYLSESELEVLIEKVEENELISAPSSLLEKVLEEIEETNEEKPNTPEYMERKEHEKESWEQEDVFSKLEKSKTVGKIRKKINQK